MRVSRMILDYTVEGVVTAAAFIRYVVTLRITIPFALLQGLK